MGDGNMGSTFQFVKSNAPFTLFTRLCDALRSSWAITELFLTGSVAEELYLNRTVGTIHRPNVMLATRFLMMLDTLHLIIAIPDEL